MVLICNHVSMSLLLCIYLLCIALHHWLIHVILLLLYNVMLPLSLLVNILHKLISFLPSEPLEPLNSLQLPLNSFWNIIFHINILYPFMSNLNTLPFLHFIYYYYIIHVFSISWAKRTSLITLLCHFTFNLYVYIYICVYVYIVCCMCEYIICLCISMYIIWVCKMCMCVCINVYMYMCIMCLCVYICIWVIAFICMYT